MQKLEAGHYVTKTSEKNYYVTKMYYCGGFCWELSVCDEEKQYEPEHFKTKKEAVKRIEELIA
jgi:hypothetical protein